MKMNSVKSSQISEIGHDPATKTLAVKFKTGGVYHYGNVSASDHHTLVTAHSVGSHFATNIKNQPKFPATKQ